MNAENSQVTALEVGEVSCSKVSLRDGEGKARLALTFFCSEQQGEKTKATRMDWGYGWELSLDPDAPVDTPCRWLGTGLGSEGESWAGALNLGVISIHQDP